jgi:hypothetical protein
MKEIDILLYKGLIRIVKLMREDSKHSVNEHNMHKKQVFHENLEDVAEILERQMQRALKGEELQ